MIDKKKVIKERIRKKRLIYETVLLFFLLTVLSANVYAKIDFEYANLLLILTSTVMFCICFYRYYRSGNSLEKKPKHIKIDSCRDNSCLGGALGSDFFRKYPTVNLYLYINAEPQGLAYLNNQVRVTSGLVNSCTPEGVKGIVMHELGHFKNNDLWTCLIVDCLKILLRSIVIIYFSVLIYSIIIGGPLVDFGSFYALAASYGLALCIDYHFFRPLAEMLKRFIERQQEYIADIFAAEEIGDIFPFINALSVIVKSKKKKRPRNDLFSSDIFSGLFLRHPPFKDRSKLLQSLCS